MEAPLAEFSRVLRPGGLFLTSRGTEESGRKAKVKSKTVFDTLLRNNGFENIQIAPWWKLFDRVIASRNGSSDPVGARMLSAVLQCGQCGQIQWKQEAGVLKCQQCGRELTVTTEGIALN